MNFFLKKVVNPLEDDKRHIIKDPLDATFESDSNSDVEIEGEVERTGGSVIKQEFSCFDRNCRRYFSAELAYHEHLSKHHFKQDLLKILDEFQPDGRGIVKGKIIFCPNCNFKSIKEIECITHLGIKHEVQKLLEKHILLLKRQKSQKLSGQSSGPRDSRRSSVEVESDPGIRPSLFALDDESPGELVPDVPGSRPAKKCYVGIQPNYEAVGVPLTTFMEREEARQAKMKEEYLDEDSNDSIIEVDKEQCELCGDRYEERNEVIIHIAQKHFEQGLVNQLLSMGWEDGEQTCPVCEENPGVDMVLHWATDHGKVQEMLDKCEYGGEIRLADDRKIVNDYLEENNTVKVDIVTQLGMKFAVASLMEHFQDEEDDSEDDDSVKVISDISNDVSDYEN